MMMNGSVQSPITNNNNAIDGIGINDDSDRIDDELFEDEEDDSIIIRGGGGRSRIELSGTNASGSGNRICDFVITLFKDLWFSSGLVLNNKLNWLLIMGPVALFGDATGLLGEMPCFALSGIALIPCAERLSFVTEQVAMHTNGTIGALLNATFGNAPELLIASAALRKGFYRVVQLAMLGSMLTNLLFVFGISCLIGGLRWQVQELRITSGNVSVGMLLLSTAGSLLPATLVLAGQLKDKNGSNMTGHESVESTEETIDVPTLEELQFCRVNAFVMIIMYGCYLIFQLGTHKEEFDEEDNVVEIKDAQQMHRSPQFALRHGDRSKTRRNEFCVWLVHWTHCLLKKDGEHIESRRMSSERIPTGDGDLEMMYRNSHRVHDHPSSRYNNDDESDSSSNEECLLPQNHHANSDNEDYFDDYAKETPDSNAPRLRRIGGSKNSTSSKHHEERISLNNSNNGKTKKKRNGNRNPGSLLPLGLAEAPDGILNESPTLDVDSNHHGPSSAEMSFRVGILWLFIITLGISVLSDILVDTIDGFALRLHFSEVFTSMIIVPFFSNVAEQVSAILFAYRNEMDLCVGVTVGSAIQVASFVLPGCVIIGWLVDRSMTLYFHAYETICLFLAVIVVAAVLQGGTTNWLVGATCISVYIMIATGFWFHSLEDLSVDAETIVQNATRTL